MTTLQQTPVTLSRFTYGSPFLPPQVTLNACPACLNSPQLGEPWAVHQTVAGRVDGVWHGMHERCAERWLMPRIGSTCPLCVAPILNRAEFWGDRVLSENERSEELLRQIALKNVEGALELFRSGPVTLMSHRQLLLLVHRRGDVATLPELRARNPDFSLTLLSPDEIREFFAQGNSASAQAVSVAVNFAIFIRRMDILSALLAGGRTIREDLLPDSLLLALFIQPADVVPILLENARTMPEDRLARAIQKTIIMASNENDENAGDAIRAIFLHAQPFFANRAILSEFDLARIVLNAIGQGRTDVIRALFENRRTIPENELALAVIYAADRGHLDIIRVLFENGRTVPEDALAEAVIGAADKGYSDIIRVLLQNGRTVPVPVLAMNIQETIRRGHPDAAPMVLENVNRSRARLFTYYATIMVKHLGKYAASSIHTNVSDRTARIAATVLTAGTVYAAYTYGLLDLEKMATQCKYVAKYFFG